MTTQYITEEALTAALAPVLAGIAELGDKLEARIDKLEGKLDDRMDSLGVLIDSNHKTVMLKIEEMES